MGRHSELYYHQLNRFTTLLRWESVECENVYDADRSFEYLISNICILSRH